MIGAVNDRPTGSYIAVERDNRKREDLGDKQRQALQEDNELLSTWWEMRRGSQHSNVDLTAGQYGFTGAVLALAGKADAHNHASQLTVFISAGRADQ